MKLQKIYQILLLVLVCILCNCAENFGFSILAFAGTFPIRYCIEVAFAGSIIEMLIAGCDTPFLYLAGYLNRKSGILLEKDDDDRQEAVA